MTSDLPRKREAVAATGRLPLVSVIIATNRPSPFLAEALDSVTNQTYRRIEVVIVDDGAGDPSFAAQAAARVPGATLVRQPPSGVAVARNVGAAMTTGEFLVFLDDDDRWQPERIERQVHALEGRPDAPLGYCSMQSIDEHGRVTFAADQIQVTDECDVARRATGIILPNVMVRREAFVKSGGFHPALRMAEDLDLILKLARQGGFAFSPETLVDYRSHGLNTTKRHRELSRSIDHVLRLHLWNASEHHRPDLEKAYRESIEANRRFAWWSALRAAREGLKAGRVSALGEIAWAIGFAPMGPVSALLRRLRGSR
ncbi:MAG: glycosyltransferase family 2 protein [Demequinaceae bacterium]|nr:glycosyltransferase family 2 protein [Demequinaceae bacterium]